MRILNESVLIGKTDITGVICAGKWVGREIIGSDECAKRQ